MYVVSELKLTASYTYLRNGSCNCWKHNSFPGVCRKRKNGRKETDDLKSETHAFINCIIFSISKWRCIFRSGWTESIRRFVYENIGVK